VVWDRLYVGSPTEITRRQKLNEFLKYGGSNKQNRQKLNEFLKYGGSNKLRQWTN
jgi:hypothetical protein